METNELPEEVMRELGDEASAYSVAFDYDKRPYAEEDFYRGAYVGYRLALQSKEEEIKDLYSGLKYKDDIIHDMDKTIEELEEQLKANDEYIQGLTEHRDSLTSAVEAVRSAVNLEPKMDGVLLGSCDRKKAGNALHNLFSLLSQSTDKQP